MKPIILFVLPALICAATFTAGPAVTPQGNGAQITFTVSASIDAEVAVLDGSGNIVRHLAAGVLGGTYAPPAPLAAGLSQTLTWDGTDDGGNTVADGGYNVRVRLGVKPVWKYAISTDPFPGSHRSGTYAPRLWENTVQLTNQIFNRIYNEHSNPDLFLNVNKPYNEVYFRLTNDPDIIHYRFNAETGEFIDTVRLNGIHQWQYWGEIAFSPDGEYFCHTTPLGQLYMYTRLGLPSYFPGGKVGMVSGLTEGYCMTRGVTIGRDSVIYMLHLQSSNPFSNEYGGWQAGQVSKVSLAGQIIKMDFINIDAPTSGIKVDPKGNVFVGARVRPADAPMPAYVDTAIADSLTDPLSLRWWAEDMYGSLLKFDTSGGGLTMGAGTLEGGKDLPQATPPISRYTLQARGLVWAYYGASPHLSHYGQRNSDETYFIERGSPCHCSVARFDVDMFGRIFLPDPFVLTIKALDNNRNQIFAYTHRDYPTDKLPIGWAHAIEATDKAIWVADQINDQVVCFSLDADTSVTVATAIAIEQGRPVSHKVSFGFTGNTPNPFTPSTSIRYIVPRSMSGRDVSIAVYDLSGRLVKRLIHGPAAGGGLYAADWDGRDINGTRAGTGIYLCRLRCGNMTDLHAMMLVR